MKKIIRGMFILFFIFIIFEIMSCDMFMSSKNSDNNLEQIDLKFYKTNKYTEAIKVGESYLINDMLLHTFKIGSVYNVPVYLKAGKIHDGKTSTTIELEEVKEFSQKYSTQMAICQETAVSTSVSAEVESSIGGKVGYKGAIAAEIEAKIKAGIKAGYSTTDTNSLSESEKIESIYTERRTNSEKIIIDKSSPVGYYSYIMLDDFDVYVLLSCDTKSRNEIQFSYLYISKNNIREGYVHYLDNEDENYPLKEIEKTEMLDISSLKNLNFDFYDKSNVLNILENLLIIERAPNPNKVTDDGQYGLEQDIKTELNLADYEKYMNDNYVFTFTVTIHAEAEWIDRWWFWEKDEYEEGTKHICLFKKDPGRVENSSNVVNKNTIRSKYGLLHEESWDEDVVRDKTFIWNVKGSDCTNNMCIKYDAWGDGEDTWYIKGLTVELSIGPYD